MKVHERQQSVVGQGTSLHPKLSVLMWGHDSLSRNMFIRKLPISFDFLKNKLGGTVVEGYNIVGDGTPQALIPILTGQTESELPETRKSHGQSAKFVDVYPFLWKEFRRNGYLTGKSKFQLFKDSKLRILDVDSHSHLGLFHLPQDIWRTAQT